MSRSNVPGATGIAAIIVGSVVVTIVITVVTSQLSQWIALALAVIVGLAAVAAINKG